MERFPHYVRVEYPVDVSDGRGGVTTTWKTHTEEWARFERAASFRLNQERVQSGGLRSLPIVQIHMRAHDLTEAITPQMRVYDVDRGKTFAVNVAQDIAGDGNTITITATENLPT